MNIVENFILYSKHCAIISSAWNIFFKTSACYNLSIENILVMNALRKTYQMLLLMIPGRPIWRSSGAGVDLAAASGFRLQFLSWPEKRDLPVRHPSPIYWPLTERGLSKPLILRTDLVASNGCAVKPCCSDKKRYCTAW